MYNFILVQSKFIFNYLYLFFMVQNIRIFDYGF